MCGVASHSNYVQYINRVPNLQRRNTISPAQVMRITLLMAVISVVCWSGVIKVDILRGGNGVFLKYTVEILFYLKVVT
jgi:hypothetical protein